MQARVSFRLGAVFGVIVFLTVIVSYLTLGRQLREVLQTSIGMELKRELALNREMLKGGAVRAGVEADPDGWADRIGSILDLRVTLIAIDGRVIGDSYIDRDKLSRIENHGMRPEVRGALSGSFGENARYSRTIKEQMLYMAVAVGSPRPFAVLRFAKPLYDIRAFESGVRKGIERGLFFALLFSLGVVLLTAFFIARPLRRIAETAEKRVHGDFSGTIPSHRRDEIGMLARACNFMSEEIRKMSRSEEWYRAVFSGIREAIVVTDAADTNETIDPEEIELFIKNAWSY
jgi:two-component system phosphate regulon sensor histidine kinase PhoR